MKTTFIPQNVCSKKIEIELDDNKIREVKVFGGCPGNGGGIGKLLAGMDIDDAIVKMKGIHCGDRPTSCPDQISIALAEARKAQKA